MNESTTYQTSTRRMDTVATLETIHRAQAALLELPEGEAHDRLADAITTALCVLVIYLKAGRTPKITKKHAKGIAHFQEVFAE